jgi:type I restriction enzyme M protein
MYGAIIGDIVGSQGSQFEGKPNPGVSFELFTPRCRFTDDTLMTLAIADAIMQSWQFVSQLPGMDTTENRSPLDHPAFHEILAQYTISCMQKLGRAYPGRGFGERFMQWVFSDEPKPYNSFGNGAAMRVSPVAYIARSEAEVLSLAKTVTEITHNHPEGIIGAQATALAIWYGLEDLPQSELRDTRLMDFYPNFHDVFFMDIDDSFPRDTSCQRTVPFALLALLDSDDFEGAIRNAISLGGDTDTLAAITGSIAEAYLPVPPEFILSANNYLDQTLIDIITRWHDFLKTLPGKAI